MFEYRHEVQPQDLQPLYGHLNHARALSILEKAREKLLEAIGHPLETLIERGYFVVVTRMEVDYKREILAGGGRVTCEQGALEGKLLRLRQRLYNQRGREAVCALVELQAIGRREKRAQPFPADFAADFRRFFGDGAVI